MNTGYRNLVDWAARSSAGLSCILRPFRNHIREPEPDPDAIEFGFETVFCVSRLYYAINGVFFLLVCVLEMNGEWGFGLLLAERW